MGNTLDSCLNKKKKDENLLENHNPVSNSSYDKGVIRENRVSENKMDRESASKSNKTGSRKPTDVNERDEEPAKKKIEVKNRPESDHSDEDMFQSKPIQPFDLKKQDPHETMKRDGLPLTTLSTTSADFNIVDDNSISNKQIDSNKLLNIQNPDIFCNKTIKVTRNKPTQNNASTGAAKFDSKKDEDGKLTGIDKETKDTDTIDKNFFDKKPKRKPESPSNEELKLSGKSQTVTEEVGSGDFQKSDFVLKDNTLLKGSGSNNEGKNDEEIQIIMNKQTIEKK